jgi:hypothetical protein
MARRLCLKCREYKPLGAFRGPAAMCMECVAAGGNVVGADEPQPRRTGLPSSDPGKTGDGSSDSRGTEPADSTKAKRRVPKRGKRTAAAPTRSRTPPKRSSESLARHRMRLRAEQRAKTVLSQRHREEYQGLVSDELRKDHPA